MNLDEAVPEPASVRRRWPGLMVAVGLDVMLAFLLFVAIGVDRVGREGIRPGGVNSSEYRDWLVILCCWALLMAGIGVYALLTGRKAVALLQIAVAAVVILAWTPALQKGLHEGRHPPGVPSNDIEPRHGDPCPQGRCPGG